MVGMTLYFEDQYLLWCQLAWGILQMCGIHFMGIYVYNSDSFKQRENVPAMIIIENGCIEN